MVCLASCISVEKVFLRGKGSRGGAGEEVVDYADMVVNGGGVVGGGKLEKRAACEG